MQVSNNLGLPVVDHLLAVVASDRVKQRVVNNISNDGWMAHVSIMDDVGIDVVIIDTTDQFCE